VPLDWWKNKTTISRVADAHRAELRGEAGAEGGGEREPGDERRDLTGVEVRRDEPCEGRDADLLKSLVSLETNLGAGEEREEGDHADAAADHGQRTGTQTHLGDEPDDLLLVGADGLEHTTQGATVERELLTGVLQPVEDPNHRRLGPAHRDAQRPRQRDGRGHQTVFCGITEK
jgi:hypothetical protein